MSPAVKLLFSTMSMLAVAAIIGVATATVTTCGVGLVQGAGTWCGLHWTWLIGFPLAVIAAVIFGLPLVFLFRKWRLTQWWQFGITGFICAMPVWIQLAQPFTSVRWTQSGLYDSLNYLGSGVASGLAYWWIFQKMSVRNNSAETVQENNVFFKKTKNVETSDDAVAAVFWGASDRMICCKGIGGETNEFNTTSHPKLAQAGYVATLEIQTASSEPALLLHAFYSGHWSFAVSPGSEDSDELPSWKITREWGSVNQHSETLTIFCPKGCNVSAVDRIADHY